MAELGPDSAAVTTVVNKFKTFLQRLKTDGYVQHVVYTSTPSFRIRPT